MLNRIILKGVKVHNLKNIDVEIPRNRLVVITGISGSGKSSLAFDTIYAEGQRRYVESLSAYARQFLGVMDKPDVEKIEGISPTISIEQRKISKNPRSTVATVTEIYDYLRVFFARLGKPYCYNCGEPITARTLDEIVQSVLKEWDGKRIMILAPAVEGRKGTHKDLFTRLLKSGYIRAVVDGRMVDIDEDIPELEKNKKHTIDVVVDRLVVKEGVVSRLTQSIETALSLGNGKVRIMDMEGNSSIYSEKLACVKCGISYPDITPRFFSFNSPYGACPVCGGLGVRMEIDPELLVPDPNLSIMEGAIGFLGEAGGKLYYAIKSLSNRYRVNLYTPFNELPEDFKHALFYGDGRFAGLNEYLLRRYEETESDWIKFEIEKYMAIHPCPGCGGKRLKKEALHVLVNGKSIGDVVGMNVSRAREFFENLKLDKNERIIAKELVKEIVKRLKFLEDVGLDYLTLDRPSETLAGGEAQRVHLATQIGSGLIGIIYILDEPSIGLHPRDIARLIATLKGLRDAGNTVIVVEHDPETIESADWVIDLGPGAGEKGGRVVATGTPEEIKKNKKSLTGAYLSGRREIPVPSRRRRPDGRYIEIKGARGNNLKNIDVKIPLGLFVCITGVSGSGKSTLLLDILYRALARKFYGSRHIPLEHDSIEGIEHIDKVINIDQSPIGRTPRSNPATYTGAYTPIREFFANLPEARIRGYKPGRFSFNVRGGRCERCEGQGIIRVEMHFLPDVYITCEVCGGKRFNRETLEVKYHGKNISDVLEMSVDEALEFFKNIPPIKRKLQLLHDVGLGYIKLGQPAPTLSGGEAQRVKLARELSKTATGRTLYILDEPTTGLHFEDVRLLLDVLQRLVDRGNTVVVIEHNLDVVKSADYIIDLGPEGGDRGGEIVATGTPEEVAKSRKSYTGKYLKKILHPSGVGG